MRLDSYLQENYQFCPRCGALLDNTAEDHLSCPSCGFKFYYNPALATASTSFNRKGQVLLGQRKREPFAGYWDTVGGFVEVGESLEQAVKREFKEETQADCQIIRYWGSSADVYGEGGIRTLNVFFEVSLDPQQTLVASDDVSDLAFFDLNKPPKKLAFHNAERFLNILKNYKEQHDRQ